MREIITQNSCAEISSFISKYGWLLVRLKYNLNFWCQWSCRSIFFVRKALQSFCIQTPLREKLHKVFIKIVLLHWWVCTRIILCTVIRLCTLDFGQKDLSSYRTWLDNGPQSKNVVLIYENCPVQDAKVDNDKRIH